MNITKAQAFKLLKDYDNLCDLGKALALIGFTGLTSDQQHILLCRAEAITGLKA